MARWASLIETRRSENPVLLLDTGDFLSDKKTTRYEISNRFLLEGMERMGYDAIAVGETDIHFGYDKLINGAKRHKLPLVSTNIIDKRKGTLLAAPYIIKHVGGRKTLFGRRGGFKVGVFSIILPQYVHSIDRAASRYYEITNTKLAAMEAVSTLRKKGCDIVVALSHQGWQNTLQFAGEVPGIDIMINAHRMHGNTHSEKEGMTLIVDTGLKRKSFTEIRISFSGDTLIAEAHELGAVALKQKEQPELIEIERRYEKEMRQQGLESFIGE